ncbi:hypothetical protein LguiA_000811 [Lonicera macranthoides]
MAALTSSLSLNKHFFTATTTTSSFSSSSVLKPISLSLYKKRHTNNNKTAISLSSSFTGLFGAKSKGGGGGGGGGASVLERPPPIFDPSQLDPATQVEQGGDIGRVRDRRGPGSADGYRVLLLDDIRHTEDLVVKVLPQAVPAVTPDGARELFHVSRENGLAVVIVTVKVHILHGIGKFMQVLITAFLDSCILKMDFWTHASTCFFNR